MPKKGRDKNLEQRSEEVIEMMNSFCEQTCEEILSNPRGNINEKNPFDILYRFHDFTEETKVGEAYKKDGSILKERLILMNLGII